MKSLCSVDALYLVFSTASAEDNIRNPRSESGISYIGSNAQTLADRGASAKVYVKQEVFGAIGTAKGWFSPRG